MRFLRVLAWLFVPYIMLPLRWTRLTTTKRFLAFAWIALMFIIGFTGNEDKKPEAAPQPTATAKQTITPSASPSISPTPAVEVSLSPSPAQSVPAEATPAASNPTAAADPNTSNQNYDVILHFPVDKYPQTAAHIQEAIQSGETPICTIDRDDADENRKESLAGIPTKTGYDRDEFPMAMCAEGGKGADVEYVPSSDNRGSGSWVGNQLEGYTDGTRVLFVLDGGLSGSVEAASGTVAVAAQAQIQAPVTTPEPLAPLPTPTEALAAKQPSSQSNVYYANCTEAKKAGAYNIRRGDPGYSSKLDRDNDGVACER